MRAFAGNFTETEMKEAVRFAHAHGVRVHVTVNTMPRNDEVARLLAAHEAELAGRAPAPVQVSEGPYQSSFT
jgi:collagenase-like PrtC family protease